VRVRLPHEAKAAPPKLLSISVPLAPETLRALSTLHPRATSEQLFLVLGQALNELVASYVYDPVELGFAKWQIRDAINQALKRLERSRAFPST